MATLRVSKTTADRLEKTRQEMIASAKDPVTKERLIKATMDVLVYFCATLPSHVHRVENMAEGFFGSSKGSQVK